MGLVLRRIKGVLKRGDGTPKRAATIRCKLRRDVGMSGVFVPGGDVIETKTDSLGRYDFNLYSIAGAVLNWRCSIDDAAEHKFSLAPGGEIAVDQLFELSEVVVPDVPSAMTAVENLITAHEARENPHAQYLRQNDAANLVTAHEDRENPHPQYLRQSEVESVVEAHEARENPHAQYLLQSDFEAATEAIIEW